MPLADLTAVANLALDHIGEPYLEDIDTDTGTTAEAVRLHLNQCIETVLEGHVWSFATRTTNPDQATTTPTAATLSAAFGLVFTATTAGAAGNDITIALTSTDEGAFSKSIVTISGVDGFPILSLPGIDGDISLTDIKLTFENHASAAIISIAYADGYTGTEVIASHDGGTLVSMAETPLAGGLDPDTILPSYFGSAWQLPADCLRLIQINGIDIDVPENRFELQGRCILLEDAYAEDDADPPQIRYITNSPPVGEWPTTFTDAVAFLLASRLAPKLAQSPQLANDLFQKHEIALGKARSKDTRETRSKENNTPRMLAARSGLVQARYQRTNRPPY